MTSNSNNINNTRYKALFTYMENHNSQQLFPTTPGFSPPKGNVILPQEGGIPHCHLPTLAVKCMVWNNNLDPPTQLQALPLMGKYFTLSWLKPGQVCRSV